MTEITPGECIGCGECLEIGCPGDAIKISTNKKNGENL